MMINTIAQKWSEQEQEQQRARLLNMQRKAARRAAQRGGNKPIKIK